MVVSQLSILLDNPEAVYHAGQNVTGKLFFVVVTDTESFKSIQFECKGFAKVNFNQEESIYTDGDIFEDSTLVTKTTFYHGSEKYLKISLPLKAASDGNHLIFKVGQHSFPFDFTLPNSIPSSVEGQYGHIRYVLSGQLIRTIDMKQHKKDEHCSMNIAFNNLVDLNLNPAAKMPASGTVSQNISCCCFRRGPITAQAWINKSGYAPGETLYFNAKVENLSGKTMEGSTVQLFQEIVYLAQGGRKVSTRFIRNASHASFGPSDVWENVPFLIPYVAPSDEHLSSLIKISYRLLFMVLPGSYIEPNFAISLDVIIGNIPISSSSIENLESKMISSRSVIDAPPKYEDCFFAGSSGVDSDEASNCTPRYVTFAITHDDDFF